MKLENFFVSNINSCAIVTNDELGKDILRCGQLYPLLVEKEIDNAYNEIGRHSVIAGGAGIAPRFIFWKNAASTMILQLNLTFPIARPAFWREIIRLPRMCRGLICIPWISSKNSWRLWRKALSEADVAAAYFVSPLIVRQGIKLARVAPELFEDYIAKEMTLEQLEAFAITDNQERQSHVWASLRYIPYGQSLIRSNGI